MKAAGKGVIGMKILGQGALVDRIDECLRFALSLGCVDCFTIGVESRRQLDDLVRRVRSASEPGQGGLTARRGGVAAAAPLPGWGERRRAPDAVGGMIAATVPAIREDGASMT